jgi:hypothetical protein
MPPAETAKRTNSKNKNLDLFKRSLLKPLLPDSLPDSSYPGFGAQVPADRLCRGCPEDFRLGHRQPRDAAKTISKNPDNF